MGLDYDLFTNVPFDIIIDILARLAVRDIKRCKSVCKSWLDLVESPEFVKPHILRWRSAVPPFLAFQSAALLHNGRRLCKILELADDDDSNTYYKTIFTFLTPVPVHSSLDGLLFFCNSDDDCKSLVVMNPFTRERFQVPVPTPITLPFFGFGVSKESGEYKIVRISRRDYEKKSCDVITLGESSWRSISPPCSRFIYQGSHSPSTAFLNGKIHWLVHYINDDGGLVKFKQISVFDFETEVFSTFSATKVLGERNRGDYFYTICALEGCVCLCRSSGKPLQEEEVMEVDIWLMKEYGNDNSWTKVSSFKGRAAAVVYHLCEFVPLKFFRNGDMLMAVQHRDLLYYYSSKTTTFHSINTSRSLFLSNILLYTPSFLSPNSFLSTAH